MPDPVESMREAERLVREATERAEAIAAGEGDPPPRGYDVPGGAERPPFPDLAALAGLLDAARGALPPELARQLSQALRELLIAIRAVLDYSIERLEPADEAPPRVEDIPIE